MKKIWYSKYTKAVAVLLFMASLTLGLLAGLQGTQELSKESNFIYDFGKSLDDCWYYRSMLYSAENTVSGVFMEYEYDNVQATESEDLPPTEPYYDREQKIDLEALRPEMEQLLQKRLETMYYENQILYYVNWQGNVFTNAPGESLETLRASSAYRYLHIDTKGEIEAAESSQNILELGWLAEFESFREPGPITICTAIRPEVIAWSQEAWERQEKLTYTMAARVLCCVLAGVLSLIYLICVCGRDAEGNRLSSWTDRIWTEVHILAIAAFAVGGMALILWVADLAFSEQFPVDGAYLCAGLCMPLISGVVLSSLLSMIRNVKAGSFVKRSGLLLLLGLLWKLLKKIAKGVCKALRKVLGYLARPFRGIARRAYSVLQIGALIVYTLATVLLMILACENGSEPVVFLILLPLGGGIFYIARRGKELQHIREGATRIRKGELSYKIPDLQENDLQELRGNINDIARGLNESVAAKVKAERMKTELITNVSHDLKTPLTSIISYTELLTQMEGLPQEAMDYIRIIAGKSDRLKQLTQDLFDISKAQSGNEEILLEKLDASLLLQQAVGELDKEIEQSGLKFCLKTTEELYITADGRKLSRVLGNLIHNALKYSMKNTRVFLSTAEEQGRVVLECKNVASYLMDFTGEEITGRFVRGDCARSTEGSGLGLAIAKSYTELCGGKLEVLIDGDLFKVRLSFPKYEA